MLPSFRVLWIVALLATPTGLTGQDADPAHEVAISYLNTLYAFDFEALGSLLTVDASFADPTAVALGGSALSAKGRDEILTSFEAGAGNSRTAGFEVERQFTTGNYVVLTLIYTAEIDGDAVGIPGAWVPVRVPAVTVLRIEGSQVSEHVDHVDYEEMLRQIATFAGRTR